MKFYNVSTSSFVMQLVNVLGHQLAEKSLNVKFSILNIDVTFALYSFFNAPIWMHEELLNSEYIEKEAINQNTMKI